MTEQCKVTKSENITTVTCSDGSATYVGGASPVTTFMGDGYKLIINGDGTMSLSSDKPKRDLEIHGDILQCTHESFPTPTFSRNVLHGRINARDARQPREWYPQKPIDPLLRHAVIAEEVTKYAALNPDVVAALNAAEPKLTLYHIGGERGHASLAHIINAPDAPPNACMPAMLAGKPKYPMVIGYMH